MKAVYNSRVVFFGNTHSQIVYDPLGRMTDKQADGQTVFANADFSVLPGQPARPHAMKSAETAEGVFPLASQEIVYTAFDKVKTIAEGGSTLAYTYGYDQQPSHPLALKTTYAIDRYIFLDYKDDEDYGDTLEWRGTDTMYVDYIKVLQLRCDCDADKVIACQTDLDTLKFKVKKSYNISSKNGNVTVSSTDKKTFRATDYFEITGPFQTDLGGELTVIMQECPDTAPETTKQPTYKNNTP